MAIISMEEALAAKKTVTGEEAVKAIIGMEAAIAAKENMTKAAAAAGGAAPVTEPALNMAAVAGGMAAVIAPDPEKKDAKEEAPAGPTKEEIMAMSEAAVYSGALEKLRTERAAQKGNPFIGIICDVVKDRCLHSTNYCRRVLLGTKTFDMLMKYIQVKAIRDASTMKFSVLPTTNEEVYRWVDEFYCLNDEAMEKLKNANMNDMLRHLYELLNPRPERPAATAKPAATKDEKAEKKPKKKSTRKSSKKKTSETGEKAAAETTETAKGTETAKPGTAEPATKAPETDDKAAAPAASKTPPVKEAAEPVGVDEATFKPAPEGDPVQMSLFG